MWHICSNTATTYTKPCGGWVYHCALHATPQGSTFCIHDDGVDGVAKVLSVLIAQLRHEKTISQSFLPLNNHPCCSPIPCLNHALHCITMYCNGVEYPMQAANTLDLAVIARARCPMGALTKELYCMPTLLRCCTTIATTNTHRSTDAQWQLLRQATQLDARGKLMGSELVATSKARQVLREAVQVWTRCTCVTCLVFTCLIKPSVAHGWHHGAPP